MYFRCVVFVVLMGVTVNTYAGTFQRIVSESVGVEAATSGDLTANIAGDSIALGPGTTYQLGDRLIISVSNGAKFGDAVYSLEQSVGGAGFGVLSHFKFIGTSPDGDEIEFKVASDISGDYLLSGSSIAAQAVTFQMPRLGAGTGVSVEARALDSIGVYERYSSLELFQYANEFSANVDTVANEEIDVNSGRTRFGALATDVTDRIAVEFREANITNGVALGAGDFFEVTLSGDMTGVDSIIATARGSVQGSAAIDAQAGTAFFSFEASDLSIGNASAILDINVDDETVLATREFTVSGELILAGEDDYVLLPSGTAAGEWTINGLQAKVSHLSLNSTGFLSWLKVMNTGTLAVEVYADIIYTLADGTEGVETAKLLGSVDAGGVGTISELDILAAIGNPTQLVDAHLTVTVTGEDNTVHLIAEKRASNGRVSVPVYYDNGNGAGREWMR